MSTSSSASAGWMGRIAGGGEGEAAPGPAHRGGAATAVLAPGALMQMLLLLLLLLSLLLPPTLAPAAPAALLQVDQHDGALRVVASASLRADLQTSWDTLVDYDRLPEFVPDLRSSRTLQRDGAVAVVAQSGRAGFGPLHRDFTLTLRVREEAPYAVTASAVAGSFTRFESSYRLRAEEGGITHLSYRALIEPRDGVPPLLGLAVMRWALERQFQALLVEIERRAALGVGAGAMPAAPK